MTLTRRAALGASLNEMDLFEVKRPDALGERRCSPVRS